MIYLASGTFLYDIGVVPTPEPYKKRRPSSVLSATAKNEQPRQCRRPNDVIDICADTLRTYILFMGDYGAAAPQDSDVRDAAGSLTVLQA